MPITKNDLISDVAIICGITKDNARIAVEQIFDIVKCSVKANKSVELRGFGTFSPKTCNERMGRNLKTGELIPLAANKSMSFKYSPELKGRITGKETATIQEIATVQESVSQAIVTQAVATAQVQSREFAETGLL